jgi:AhpD family alkylhydroperoxidase
MRAGRYAPGARPHRWIPPSSSSPSRSLAVTGKGGTAPVRRRRPDVTTDDQPGDGRSRCLPTLLGLSKFISKAGVPQQTLDLVHLLARQINGCAGCIHLHAGDLGKSKETDERPLMTAAWRETPCFSDAERRAGAGRGRYPPQRPGGPGADEVWEKGRPALQRTRTRRAALGLGDRPGQSLEPRQRLRQAGTGRGLELSDSGRYGHRTTGAVTTPPFTSLYWEITGYTPPLITRAASAIFSAGVCAYPCTPNRGRAAASTARPVASACRARYMARHALTLRLPPSHWASGQQQRPTRRHRAPTAKVSKTCRLPRPLCHFSRAAYTMAV